MAVIPRWEPQCSSTNQTPLLLFPEIIDDLTNLVENTDEKLRTETRRVGLVEKKSASCGKSQPANTALPVSSLAPLPCAESPQPAVCLINMGVWCLF